MLDQNALGLESGVPGVALTLDAARSPQTVNLAPASGWDASSCAMAGCGETRQRLARVDFLDNGEVDQAWITGICAEPTHVFQLVVLVNGWCRVDPTRVAAWYPSGSSAPVMFFGRGR